MLSQVPKARPGAPSVVPIQAVRDLVRQSERPAFPLIRFTLWISGSLRSILAVSSLMVRFPWSFSESVAPCLANKSCFRRIQQWSATPCDRADSSAGRSRFAGADADAGDGHSKIYGDWLGRPIYYEGNCVVIDQGLGLSGATGRVSGPHLHWAVRWQGAYLDPAKLLRLNLRAAR